MTSWGGVHFDGEARSLVKHQRQKFSNIFTRNQFVGSSLFTSNRKEQGYSVLLSWVMEQMDKHGVLVLAPN